MTTTTINQLCNAQLGKLKAIAASVILLTAGATAANAQTTMSSHDEQYGHTLNLGVGIGYYGYLNQDVPFIFANYEFDVARSFTLAPFIGFSSYRSDRYYDGRYYYHETIVPMPGISIWQLPLALFTTTFHGMMAIPVTGMYIMVQALYILTAT